MSSGSLRFFGFGPKPTVMLLPSAPAYVVSGHDDCWHIARLIAYVDSTPIYSELEPRFDNVLLACRSAVSLELEGVA
jgi:hypothetical protein